MKPISTKIQQARREQGLSQKQLAQLIGVNESTVYRIESGSTRDPMSSTMKKIEKVLGINAN